MNRETERFPQEKGESQERLLWLEELPVVARFSLPFDFGHVTGSLSFFVSSKIGLCSRRLSYSSPSYLVSSVRSTLKSKKATRFDPREPTLSVFFPPPASSVCRALDLQLLRARDITTLLLIKKASQVFHTASPTRENGSLFLSSPTDSSFLRTRR